MDDSHVSFGPLRENREVADETINERESTTSRHETEIVRDTHLTESATRLQKWKYEGWRMNLYLNLLIKWKQCSIN